MPISTFGLFILFTRLSKKPLPGVLVYPEVLVLTTVLTIAIRLLNGVIGTDRFILMKSVIFALGLT